MKIFPWKKRKEFFSVEEKQLIIEAIREAEKNTSGEVRVFVETRCRYVDAIDRAAEIFFQLKMDLTLKRNAVLVYLAVHDRQLAIFADEGIYKATGKEFWDNEVSKMIEQFHTEHFADGVCSVIRDTGAALRNHFPYDGVTDKNELPDDIVAGQ